MNGTAASLALDSAIKNVPLSDLHVTLARIGRDYHAHKINRFANHPDVVDMVRGYLKPPLDFGPAIADARNVLLTGQHGAILFQCLQPGLYEAHSIAVPEGRGPWMLSFTRAALHWMFARSDAVELVTRCPQGNIGALALAKRIGGKFWFRREKGWVVNNDPVPADIYRLTVQDWMETAPGLKERGHWFHDRLEAEYRRLRKADPSPHPDDDIHDRYAGMAVEMFLGGQPHKGVILYNRWAAMAGYALVSIASLTPLTVDIQDALVVVRENDFYVATVLRGQAAA